MTLDGGPNDVRIFPIAGDVTQANGTSVVLSNGALPKNIFRQSFGQIMIGTNAHVEGIYAVSNRGHARSERRQSTLPVELTPGRGIF